MKETSPTATTGKAFVILTSLQRKDDSEAARSVLETIVKTALAVLAATTTITHSALAEERTIDRRSPACVVQKDVDAFYDLMRNQPRMQDLAEFLRAHECLSLKSGDRVTIEREDPGGLYNCVHVTGRTPCYWARRSALKR